MVNLKISEWIMAKRLFSALITISLYLLIVGCSTTHHAVSDPDYSPVRPMSVQPLPVTDGAIYKAGFGVTLFEDMKAHRIGDIITVILQEKTNSTKKS